MKTVFEGDHLKVIENDGWQYVERTEAHEAVAVIAVTDEGAIVLTEQFRRPVGKRVIDFPAGLVGDDEGTSDPRATAKKELEEETGYTCASVEFVTKGPSSAGITSEIVSIYRASGLRRVAEGGGVGGEDITVHTIPLQDLPQWLETRAQEGLLVDLKLGLWAAAVVGFKS